VVGEAVKIIRAAREWTRSGLESPLRADHELGRDLDAWGRDEHNARELWHARRTTLAFSALTVGAVTGACSARGVTRATFTVLAVPPAAVAAWTGTFSYLIDVHQRISRTHRNPPA
jgi:hypothetical protein